MRPRTPEGKVLFTWPDLPTISPPDSFGYELYEGELCVSDTPSITHQEVVKNLFLLLHRGLEQTGRATVLFAPMDVVLSETTVFEPDVLVVSTPRKAQLLAGGRKVMGPPEWVIEVLSPSNAQRDRTRKTDLYLRFGVKEVWLVDPVSRGVEVVCGPADRPGRAAFGPEATVTSSSYGIAVRLADVFRSGLDPDAGA